MGSGRGRGRRRVREPHLDKKELPVTSLILARRSPFQKESRQTHTAQESRRRASRFIHVRSSAQAANIPRGSILTSNTTQHPAFRPYPGRMLIAALSTPHSTSSSPRLLDHYPLESQPQVSSVLLSTKSWPSNLSENTKSPSSYRSIPCRLPAPTPSTASVSSFDQSTAELDQHPTTLQNKVLLLCTPIASPSSLAIVRTPEPLFRVPDREQLQTCLPTKPRPRPRPRPQVQVCQSRPRAQALLSLPPSSTP